MISSRPEWQPPDKNPQDLVRTSQAMLKDFNPNDPEIPAAERILHNYHGTLKKNLTWYRDTSSNFGNVGLQSSSRKGKHRALGVSKTVQDIHSNKTKLYYFYSCPYYLVHKNK